MNNYRKNCGQTTYEKITETSKNDLRKKISTYKNYISEQKDMARKSFKCTTVEYYDDTGKIKYMEFTEK